jgi:hypothetical protein
MSRQVKKAVSGATLRVLEPLVRFLLEARLGIGDLEALSRRAYVRTAAQNPANSRDGYLNVTRIAATTGLTRIEVSKLLAEERDGPPRARKKGQDRGRVRAERVLQGWWTDPKFQDASGGPARLPRRGASRSFASLVKRYSGDANNTAAVLLELLESQAVREHDGGMLEAVSHTCVNVRWDEEGIEQLGEELAEHFETLLYNLKNPDQRRFAKRVVCANLDVYEARVLVPELAEQAEVFLEGAQETLTRPSRASKPRTPKAEAMRFAVALQFFQQPAPTNRAQKSGVSLGRIRPPGTRRLPRSPRSRGGL